MPSVTNVKRLCPAELIAAAQLENIAAMVEASRRGEESPLEVLRAVRLASNFTAERVLAPPL